MNNPTLDKTSSETYLNNLLKQCQAKSSVIDAEYLQNLQKNAVSQVKELSLPTKRDEEWRFTDLSELYQLEFTAAKSATVSQEIADIFILPETQKSCIVFVNGQYVSELSNVSALSTDIYVGNLSNLSELQKNKIVKYLGKQEGERDAFTALNTAGINDAAVIWVNPNVIVENPIQLLFLAVANDTPTLIQPRTLVVAETGSSVSFVEYYGRLEQCSDVQQNQPYFTNSVTEIWLEDNAQINHSRIQRELADSFHIGKSAITQNQDSRYTCNEVNLGAKLSRHTLQIWQNGNQTETHLNGLTMIDNQQVSDTHTAVLLNHPYGTTHQLHKCIIDGNGHGVFNGKIFVPKPAQVTNATQLNRNLLLSSKARINTKPELQITADNVKCSHGATISQLEADELFYLQSRGLNETDARHLLIDAFAAEILERIPLNSLRQRLTQCVACRTVDA
ncbi:Fe-S cluster assembly protein SufD [Crocosphaera sp. UHCC 0190]|uniref:Fe-S cluster assembly protein SufD n=1 Tax=Crocosphaera sp. UHCC 0190 TaxID=3110246 RepID=UPI002B2179D6|nr:Fe-S cluster assembly protein SufD [Crocosphaera sp. UHCC 0190]MEA5508231.1 Fe-S cluster assembly protein SufD [Crocosphaera sp. UHCC 0190]